MVKREDLADFVRRIIKEKRITTQDVEERAKRRGRKITRGYVSQIIGRTITNLTVEKLKALAAGLSVTEKDVFDRVINETPDPDFHESDFGLLHKKYKQLSESDRKEVRTLVKAIDREIEWRLSND